MSLPLPRVLAAIAGAGFWLAGCAAALDGGQAATRDPMGRATPATGASAGPTPLAQASVPAPTASGLEPAGPPAGVYSSNPSSVGAAPPDRLRDIILREGRAAARRAGRAPPTDDPRLDWAMTDLARRVRGDDLPASEAVDFLLGHYGLVEPSPQLMLAGTSADGEEQIRDNARAQLTELERAGPIARIGVGVDRAGGEIHVAIAAQPSHLELSAPVPRQLARGGRAAIAARIEAGYREPTLVITTPDGLVHESPPSALPGQLAGELRCGPDGRYQVEIAATGAAGPAVLANFPVYCGQAPPRCWTGAASMQPETSDPAEIEREIVALINRDRARAKLPALVVDPRLGEVARAHGRDMAEHDFVGHVSPRTGSAIDRVRRAGLSPRLVSENVGRAYSADEAEAGFLASPGHRNNLLDPNARRVGVGVVMGPSVTGTRPLLVTQLFTD